MVGSVADDALSADTYDLRRQNEQSGQPGQSGVVKNSPDGQGRIPHRRYQTLWPGPLGIGYYGGCGRDAIAGSSGEP